MTLDAATNVPDFEDFDDDSGEGAFFTNLTGIEDPKKKTAAPNEDEAETGGFEVEKPEVEMEVEKPEAELEADPDDEGEFEYKAGEETKKVSVKEIKRLLASEAEITTKSQAVTQAETVAKAETTRATTALNKMLERAKAKFEPYSKLNFFTLANEVDKSVFLQIQKDAQEAHAEVDYFQTELNTVTSAATAQAVAANQAAAAESVKVLTNVADKRHIPGFNKDVYQAILGFATDAGMNPAIVNQITDPGALKIFHMAMEYAKGKATATDKVAKVIAKPTKVLRPSVATGTSKASGKVNDALARLRRSGSEDDAAAAFQASFNRSDD